MTGPRLTKSYIGQFIDPYSFFSQTSALIEQLEKYLASAKWDAEDDTGNDTLVAIEQLERQLQHHYELACKKAEMQENQRSAVLKKLDSITAELQSHAIKVENGLEGKKEILNEMILLEKEAWQMIDNTPTCLLYTSPSPRDRG